MSKLLGIFAHPDDESFAAGGTIAKYVKAGWQVDLVCATHGDVAKPEDDPRLLKPQDIRKKEIEKAAAELGVTSIIFLDYAEGHVSSEAPGEIEDKLATILVEQKPDVIITMEPNGMSNNPDHIKLSLSSTFAFQQYAGVRHHEKTDIENPPKLYYSCMPESIMTYFVKKGYVAEESFEKPWVGVEDKRVTTIIDIKRFTASKRRAILAHESQTEKVNQYLSIPNNPFSSQEYFILRYIGENEVFMGKNDRISDRI